MGRSDPIPAVYRLADHAEDVRAVIEGAGHGPVVFVGMSRAAALGVVIATTYPHLVEKLILIGTPPSVAACAPIAMRHAVGTRKRQLTVLRPRCLRWAI